jgi:hypothetical protein
MAEKKQTEAPGLPDVDILMKGLLAQPGVEGYMVFNDSGTGTGLLFQQNPTRPTRMSRSYHCLQEFR